MGLRHGVHALGRSEVACATLLDSVPVINVRVGHLHRVGGDGDREPFHILGLGARTERVSCSVDFVERDLAVSERRILRLGDCHPDLLCNTKRRVLGRVFRGGSYQCGGGESCNERQALVSVAYEIITSTPKTHQARVIDLDTGTVDQIRRHRQRQQDDRHEWDSNYQDRNLVFCKEDGTPIHPHTFSQAFERLVAKTDLPRIRLHDLRHTHATIALKANIPVKVISERLGHETPAFTMKQYAHVITGMQAEAAQVISIIVREARHHHQRNG